MPLEPRDHELSMRISPRARQMQNNQGLRSLLVHRLADTGKAVARIPLRRDTAVSYFCEPCTKWTTSHSQDFENEWRCPHCERLYLMEFAVLEDADAPAEDEPHMAVLLPRKTWRSLLYRLQVLDANVSGDDDDSDLMDAIEAIEEKLGDDPDDDADDVSPVI